jgi:hypothetical protein
MTDIDVYLTETFSKDLFIGHFTGSMNVTVQFTLLECYRTRFYVPVLYGSSCQSCEVIDDRESFAIKSYQ